MDKYTIIINDLYTTLLINYKFTDRVFLTSDIKFIYINVDDPYCAKGYTTICLEQIICELFEITHATFYDHRTNQ